VIQTFFLLWALLATWRKEFAAAAERVPSREAAFRINLKWPVLRCPCIFNLMKKLSEILGGWPSLVLLIEWPGLESRSDLHADSDPFLSPPRPRLGAWGMGHKVYPGPEKASDTTPEEEVLSLNLC
jgi:hypothetical protein